MKLKLSFLAFTMVVAMQVVASPTVQNVTAKQRFPWNGLVDVKFDVVGDVTEGTYDWNVELVVVATNQVTGEAWIANNLIGETGTAEGTHNIMWDMKAQGLNIKSDDIQFIVTYRRKWNIDKSMKYCVIDLSGGSNATKYPVSYLADVPQGGWSSEHKTSKLVLRLIEPGSFMMQGKKKVHITKPFYIGVFEVTEGNVYRIMGRCYGDKATQTQNYLLGSMLPCGYISYNTIRGSDKGANWPKDGGVDSSSIIGKIRSKVGVEIDLPTEAQWEYACRAGTETLYSYGDVADSNYMWYGGHDTSYTALVGGKLPNPWGLYDMHGNAGEWVLDWHGDITGNEAVNPFGPQTGSTRVVRSRVSSRMNLVSASECTSSSRFSYAPNMGTYYSPDYTTSLPAVGIRLCMPIQ